MTVTKLAFIKIMKKVKNGKTENAQNMKMIKRVSIFTLRNGGSFFGLKTGSRGTPWNSKNAGPGGSEFTKCRFWSFKWHFGLFEGGSLFWCFFVIFWWFKFYHFFHFYTFLFLSLFNFFTFLGFGVFCISWFLIIFCHFLMLWSFFVTFCH